MIAFKERIESVVEALRAWLDIRDVVFVIAVGMFAYGLWVVYPPAAFIGTGALFIFLILWGSK